MATKATEKKDITGLDQASDRREAEYDLVTSLLSAAEYRLSEESISTVDIKRAGKFLFSVNIHPISEADLRTARKKATLYMPNPNNKKLPPIEKDFDTAKFNSWIIYLATTEEDQEKIWGNKQVMQKYGLSLPVESIDLLLTWGEKRNLADLVYDISGLNETPDEEYQDEETFLA